MTTIQEEFNDYIQTLNKIMDWLEQEPTTKNDLEVGDLLPKYINALRKCAKEHEKDHVPTFNIRTTDLCNDTAELLEQIHHQQNIFAYANDMEVSVKQAEKELRVESTPMIDKSNFSQDQYKADMQSAYDCGYVKAITNALDALCGECSIHQNGGKCSKREQYHAILALTLKENKQWGNLKN